MKRLLYILIFITSSLFSYTSITPIDSHEICFVRTSLINEVNYQLSFKKGGLESSNTYIGDPGWWWNNSYISHFKPDGHDRYYLTINYDTETALILNSQTCDFEESCETVVTSQGVNICNPCLENETYNNITDTCDIALPNETHRDDLNSTLMVYYDDDSIQTCSKVNDSISRCFTVDKDGNLIDNLPIDSQTYLHPDALSTSRLFSIAGVTLSVIGGAVAIVGTAPIALAGGLSLLAHGAVSSAIGMVLDNDESVYTTNTEINDNVSATDNAIKVDLLKYDVQQELPQVEKSIDTENNTVSTVYNDRNELVEVTETPTEVKVETTLDDGSTEVVTVPKAIVTAQPTVNDLSETNNVPEYDFTVETTPKPTINNDGSVTPSETTKSFVHKAPANGVYGFGVVEHYTTSKTTTKPAPKSTTDSSSTSTATTSTDANGTTTTTTTTTGTASTDNSDVTKRLDTIINQNTKLNEGVSTLVDGNDELTTEVDAKKSQTESWLDSVTNSTDGIEARYNDVISQFETLRDTVDTGFTNNLPTATVTSCPYNRTLDGMGLSIPISIDLCAIVTPFYASFYFIFYIAFFVAFFRVAFHLLISSGS